MSVKSTLEKIKETIEEKGYCRHELMNEEGEVCLLGAWAIVEGVPEAILQNHYYSYDNFNEFPYANEIHSLLAECAIDNFSDFLTDGVKMELLRRPSKLYNINDELGEKGTIESLECSIAKAEVKYENQ